MASSSCSPSCFSTASWASRLARKVSLSVSTWVVRTGTRSGLLVVVGAVVVGVLGPQDVLLDLASRGLGQLVGEDDRLGHLVPVQGALQRGDQLGRVDRLAGLGYHDGGDRLAPVLVRQADDHDLGHP